MTIPGSLLFLLLESSMLKYLQREIGNNEELGGIQKIFKATEHGPNGWIRTTVSTETCPDHIESPIRKVLHCGLLKFLRIDDNVVGSKSVFDLSSMASLVGTAEDQDDQDIAEDDDDDDARIWNFVHRIWPNIQQKHIWEGEDLWPTDMHDTGKVFSDMQLRFRRWPYNVAQDINRVCSNAVDAMKDAVNLQHFESLTDQQKRDMYCRIAQRELKHVLYSKLCPVFTCPRCKQPSVTCCQGSFGIYFTCGANVDQPRLGVSGCGKFHFRAVKQAWIEGFLSSVDDPGAHRSDTRWFLD